MKLTHKIPITAIPSVPYPGHRTMREKDHSYLSIEALKELENTTSVICVPKMTINDFHVILVLEIYKKKASKKKSNGTHNSILLVLLYWL